MFNLSQRRMIDYIKVAINSASFAYSLRSHPLLCDLKEVRNVKTNNTTIIGKYRGLTFKVFNTGYIEIDGSLHKYFNDGRHNYNDFSPSDLREVIADLERLFGEEIASARILNLEYGLNINTPFDPTIFTNSILTYLKSGADVKARQKNPITKNDRKGFDKGVRFILSQYHLKIYNKSKQYDQPNDILRVEFKTLKTEVIQDSGIKTVADLTDLHKLEYLQYKLIHSLEFLLIKEQINPLDLNSQEKRIWQECINPDNWIHGWNKDKRKKRKAQFAEIQKKYALSDMNDIVKGLLSDKYQQLTHPDTNLLIAS